MYSLSIIVEREAQKLTNNEFVTFTSGLSWWYSLSLFSMYSIMIRIIRMMAIIRDPKARVPKW
jgi:hypothetical protein